MSYRKTNHLLNVLDDDEMDIYKRAGIAGIRYVMTKYNVSQSAAYLRVAEIHVKVVQNESFERRQEERGLAINLAKITAKIHDTNELLIMSNL